MKKCVIYSRVSTEEQDFKSQINDLRKYAKLNDLKVIETFDETVSGYDLSKERLEYDRMKQYVLDNNVKQILVWELSRFGRTTKKTLEQIEYFSDKGINIYFKKENLNSITDEATSKLLLTMLSAISELERSTIIERAQRGMKESASKGKRAGLAVIPFGYTSDDKGYLVIDKEEAKHVRYAFERIIKKNSLRSVAQHFNSLPVLTRWNKLGRKTTKVVNDIVVKSDPKWKHTTIKDIIRNPFYKGKRKWKNEFFSVPRIVSDEEWDKAQEALKEKVGYTTKPTTYNYLLRNKIQCGSCGRTYRVKTELRYNKEQTFYDCTGRGDASIKCKNRQIGGELIDRLVYERIVEHSKFYMTIKKETDKNFNKEEKEGQVKYYSDEIKENNSKSKRLIEMYKDGYISKKEFDRGQNKIRLDNSNFQFEVDKVKNEIKNFKNKTGQKEFGNTYVKYWATSDFNTKKEFIDKYLNKVVLHKITDIKISDKDIKDSDIDNIDTEYFKRDISKLSSWGEVYLEIFAFDIPKPLRVFVKTSRELYYHSEGFRVTSGTLSFDGLWLSFPHKTGFLEDNEDPREVDKFWDSYLPQKRGDL